jgi:hypothetical protein
MEHKIFSQAQLALAAEGTSTLVVFDYEANRPHPVPDEIRKAMEALEAARSRPIERRPTPLRAFIRRSARPRS